MADRLQWGHHGSSPMSGGGGDGMLPAPRSNNIFSLPRSLWKWDEISGCSSRFPWNQFAKSRHPGEWGIYPQKISDLTIRCHWLGYPGRMSVLQYITVPGSLRVDTLEAVRLPKLYVVVHKCKALQPVLVSTPCFRLLVSVQWRSSCWGRQRVWRSPVSWYFLDIPATPAWGTHWISAEHPSSKDLILKSSGSYPHIAERKPCLGRSPKIKQSLITS